MKPSVNIFWFRRDLRLDDNKGLHFALRSGLPVVPLYIFDSDTLDRIEEKRDRRVWFIHSTLQALQARLREMDSALEIYQGQVCDIFQELLGKYDIQSVFINTDYEPSSTLRDMQVEQLLKASGIVLNRYKDLVIFEKSEVVKQDGQPYTVFTPYCKRWKLQVTPMHLAAFPTAHLTEQFYRQPAQEVPTLASFGFQEASFIIPSVRDGKARIASYGATRDFPALLGTSRLGLHLRFGTLSIRELVTVAQRQSEAYCNELVWREFYHMILWHFPRVGQGRSFKPEYEYIHWRNHEGEFAQWCHGLTGYPLVDAGMRELNQTGYMHNRVRMIAASFLSKHLLIDWRWGEAYFAEKLLDYDLAANNGGWQWAAGSGCDAAPYFRVFNPLVQAQRFDAESRYIRCWVPEVDAPDYPNPIVEHATARTRALDTYSQALRRRLSH